MKKLDRIDFRAESDLSEKIREMAKAEQRTPSGMAREICRRYIDKQFPPARYSDKGLTSHQKAWLEIMAEFESRPDDETRMLRRVILEALRSANIKVDEIFKRYR